MKINFVDLKKQYEDLDLSELNSIIKTGQFVGGPILEEFESNIAEYCGSKHAVGVGSGTDALRLSLLAIGIGPGDEVLVPANTFVATAFAVSHTGADVVFVDVNKRTYNIEVSSAGRSLTGKTKAIMPVHLYGNPCDMDAVMSFANRNGLMVIEDCAQAIGATFNNKKVGSFGNTGCFSFYPSKNLGGLGQGGAVVSDDENLINKIRAYGNVGRKEGSWYEYDLLGFNSRLDTINAWFLNKGLEKIDENNKKRIEVAINYNRRFATYSNIIPPTVIPGVKHVYHLYEICFRNKDTRDSAQEVLKSKGVPAALHYPVPCHKQEVYKNIKRNGLYNSESLANTLLSLPMHPNLKDEEVKYICNCLKESFK